MKPHIFHTLLLTAIGLAALSRSTSAASALVSNGDFEVNTGLGQIDVVTTATGWTNSDAGFNFVADSNADSTGFPSENSVLYGFPNILLWGPNTGVNNGFNGSPTGGNFLVSFIDYKNSAVSQVISGLTVGHQYTLEFSWAAGQISDGMGSFTAGWNIGFGTDAASTGLTSVASRGFVGWDDFSCTFTAASTSETLSLTATGAATGMVGVAMVDGITLTDVTPVPEPSTYALFGAGMLGIAWLRRRWIK